METIGYNTVPDSGKQRTVALFRERSKAPQGVRGLFALNLEKWNPLARHPHFRVLI
jgi:hypothetical protein